MTWPYEAQIQQSVIEHWQWFKKSGTLVAAIPNAGAAGQPGLTEGLADLLVMGPMIKVGFIELKRTNRSVTSDAQLEFEALCRELGVAYARTTGRDEPIEVLERWKIVKERR